MYNFTAYKPEITILAYDKWFCYLSAELMAQAGSTPFGYPCKVSVSMSTGNRDHYAIFITIHSLFSYLPNTLCTIIKFYCHARAGNSVSYVTKVGKLRNFSTRYIGHCNSTVKGKTFVV